MTNGRLHTNASQTQVHTASPHPKISASLATYKKLQEVALEADQSISSVANQAIDHALGELKWAKEE